MRIFRETYGSKAMKATVLFENATQEDWNNIFKKAVSKADTYGKFELPCLYPESNLSFSVKMKNGKKFRFRRTAN